MGLSRKEFNNYDWSNRQKIISDLKNDILDIDEMSLEMRDDEEFVRAAIENDPYNINYASDRLKDSKEFILNFINMPHNYTLQWASDRLRDDKEVVLEAVKQGGWALEYTSDELKNDKEVVLEAVKQNGRALYYASDDLQDDKEVVLEAVKQDGWALQLASDSLKDDKNVLNAARDYLMSEDCSTSEFYIKAKESLLRYDREYELLSKLADLDKLQAQQQNSINQPKAEVKSRRKI